MTLEELERQVEVIGKRYEFITQSDIAELALDPQKARQDRDLCLLTFDDGLREQMAAFDLLFSKGIQAVFYVPAMILKRRIVLGVHKLQFVLQKLDIEEIHGHLRKIPGFMQNESIDVASQNQYRYDDDLTRKVKYYINFILSEQQRESLVNGLFRQLVPDEQQFSERLYLGRPEVQKLSRHYSLGTHGMAHQPLGTLAGEQVRLDITESLGLLEQESGKRILSISYPYGGPTAVSEEVACIGRDCGLLFGLTMQRGLNGYNEFLEPMMLRRVDANDAPGGKAARPEYER